MPTREEIFVHLATRFTAFICHICGRALAANEGLCGHCRPDATCLPKAIPEPYKPRFPLLRRVVD